MRSDARFVSATPVLASLIAHPETALADKSWSARAFAIIDRDGIVLPFVEHATA